MAATNTQFLADVTELADAYRHGGARLGQLVLTAICTARGLVQWEAVSLYDCAIAEMARTGGRR